MADLNRCNCWYRLRRGCWERTKIMGWKISIDRQEMVVYYVSKVGPKKSNAASLIILLGVDDTLIFFPDICLTQSHHFLGLRIRRF